MYHWLRTWALLPRPFASAVFALLVLAGCATPIAETPWRAELQPAIPSAIQAYVDKRQLPGAVHWVERKGRAYAVAVGRYTYDADAAPMRMDTVFDAASLTKAVVTTPAILQLAEAGRLALDDPLVRHVPECAGEGREVITLRHLLTHTSGLAPGIPASPSWRGVQSALTLACREVPTDPPGTLFRYSDINFLLLGLIVERASGLPLDQYAATRIFGPLGMRDSTYLPLRRMEAARIAPTQRTQSPHTGLHGDLVPGQPLQGVVHDPTARFMGGVAGQAGLFTTAGDLARYARMLLAGGVLDGQRVLSEASVRLMRTVQTSPATGARRGIGWDIDSPYAVRPRGLVFPVGSYGHTGFTGCILWIDPGSRSFYVFLSNRVYPDDKGAILPLYTEVSTLSARVAGLGAP